jgi:hypothetical protein
MVYIQHYPIHTHTLTHFNTNQKLKLTLVSIFKISFSLFRFVCLYHQAKELFFTLTVTDLRGCSIVERKWDSES